MELQSGPMRVTIDRQVVDEIAHELPKMFASGVGVDEALDWAKEHFARSIILERVDPPG